MGTARKVLKIGGDDRKGFLEGLVTNEVDGAAEGLVYAAILTPQGKYLADFFLLEQGEIYLLDADADQAPALAQRLNMYKLRANVTIEDSGLHVERGTGTQPNDAFADPRHPDLGWRRYTDIPVADDITDWDAIRVAHCIPEAGVELIPNDTFILEAGFERINGVDFHKGCYVGQEVTARMKHKTELRKGFAVVSVEGNAPVGSQITRNDKAVGTLYTQSGGKGIAYLRFDRAGPDMEAGDARVSYTA